MRIHISKDLITSITSDCIIVPHFEDVPSVESFTKDIDDALDKRITRLLNDKENTRPLGRSDDHTYMGDDSFQTCACDRLG